MKQIPLTQGKIALVDNADFEHLNQWKYYAVRSRGKWYAARSPSRKLGKRKNIFMHNDIMQTPPDKEVDHIDRDGLNNQRYNLRLAVHLQNSGNRGKQSDNTSGYKGAYFHKLRHSRPWGANIGVDGTLIHLGYFYTVEEAARAYDQAAKKYFGEFANLNFPE